jgi:hypothetical protein
VSFESPRARAALVAAAALRCVPIIAQGGVSELADERDLGSRAEKRAGSSPAFPTTAHVHNAPLDIEDAWTQ